MTFAATGSTTFFTTSTFSLTPAGTGDLIAVAIIQPVNSTVFASSLSSTNATWTSAGHFLCSTNTGTGTIFLGKASSTSAATVTITWSGATPGTIRCAYQQFTSTVGAWAADGSLGHIDSAGTATWASLTPAGSGDLYFGFAWDGGTATGGSTSGYVYTVDGAHGNGSCYNVNCTSSAQAPVWGDSGQEFGPMVLVRETSSAITSTGSLAMEHLTMAGTATVAVPSSGGAAMQRLAMSGTGTVTITSSGSLAMKRLTMAGTGVQGPSASGGAAMQRLAMAGTGTVTITAAGSLVMQRLAMAGGVPPAPAPDLTVLQQVPGSAVAPSGIGTTAITTQEGSWLACFIGWNTATSGQYVPLPAVNVTDSAGNLWQQAAISVPGSASTRCAVWVAPNALPVSWVSPGLTGFAASMAWRVAEIAGMPQAAVLDFSVSTYSLSGSAPSLPWTASETGIGLAVAVAGSVPGSASVPSGWTSLGTVTAGTAATGCTVFGYLDGGISAGTATTSLALGSAVSYSYALCSLSASASPPPQANLNFPGVTVEAAFGAQPGNIQSSVDYLFSSEYVGWTDITKRVIGPAVQGRIKTKRGRPYQLQQQETGTAEMPLSNVDGAATPTNPGSPWYSNALNGNMSFQYGPASWMAQNGASLAQAASPVFASGLNAVAQYSGLVTCAAAGTPGISTGLIPVNANYPYSVSAWLHAGTAWSTGAQVGVNWYNSGHSLISGTFSTAAALPAGQWAQYALEGVTPPSGAVYAQEVVQLAGTPGTGFQFNAAEAALVTGPQTVQTGLVAPLTPVRVTAWWQGRRYPVWGGYAQQWPQEWPDMPQWGFSTLKAADALGAAAAGQMQSALIGEVLIDDPYAYLPCNESYTSQVNGATPSQPFIFSGGYLEPADANALPAVNRAAGNQVTGTYVDGSSQQASTGLAMNFLGDSGTGMGATGYGSAVTGQGGPAMLYTDPGLTPNFTTAEFWFNWSGTAGQQVTLLSGYGPQSAFMNSLAGGGNGAFMSVYAGGSTLTTKFSGASVTVPLTPSSSPQHYALTMGVTLASTPFIDVYVNGALAGATDLILAVSTVDAVILGPGRFSCDANNAPSYFDYNFAAGHLAVYPYQLSTSRILAHYQAGATGWQGVSASTRFSQILTWARLGLKRGGWSQASVTGQAEITQIGPAYDLSGQQASDAIYAVAQSEGGRYKVQANGSLIYLERDAGYNLPVSATLSDGTAPAPAALNTDPGFATGLAGWTGGGVTYSPGNRYGSLGALSAAGTVTSPAFSWNGGSASAGFWVNVPSGGTVTTFAAASGGTATAAAAVSAGAWSFLPLAVPAVSSVSSASLRVSAGTAPFYLAYAAMWYSGGQVRYLPKQSYGFDTTYIYNEVTATQQDGPNQLIIYDARGTASQAAYFRRSALSFTPDVVSAYDVSDITTWNLAGYQQPALHVSAITVDAASNPLEAFGVVLPLDTGQVALTSRHPVGGAPLAETGTVEQIGHVIGAGYWQTSCQLSPYGPAQGVLCADTAGFSAAGTSLVIAWLRPGEEGCVPLPPSRYVSGPVSPQQINSDLYGIPGQTSGVLFHATRPLLSETVLKGGTAYTALSSQTVAGKGLAAYTVIDTTALAGTGADQPGTYSTFTFTNTVPATSGVSGGYSGQWLTWNFPRLGHVTAPPGGVGAAIALNGSVEFLGTFQYGDTTQDNTPWYLDYIQATGTDVYQPAFWWLSPTVPTITASNTDSSGVTTRMGFLWQTVLSGGGTVPAVPSVATDWGTVTSAKLNSMGSALTLLNNPPSLRVSSALAQNVPASTRTVIQFPAVQLDNYVGWSTATSAYTAPLPGLYLFSNTVPWGTATSAGVRWSGLNVTAGGSTVVWQGPAYQAVPVGPGVSGVGFTSTAQARILALNAGDQVQCVAAQDSAITVPVNNAQRLIGAYMTPQAAAGTVLSYTPPVTGFRFHAGALAGTALTAALNARIGNDIGFLMNRPYFTGYQATAQTGFANSAGFHQITMDTLGAPPRGGNGDNYAGWSAANSWYVSQVAGWYLVIADLYAVPPPAGTVGILTAGIFCSSSGGVTPAATPDNYQQVYYPTRDVSPPGAFAMGMYYLQPGEYVYPMLSASSWGGTWGTQVSTGSTSTIHSQLSVFWCSE